MKMPDIPAHLEQEFDVLCTSACLVMYYKQVSPSPTYYHYLEKKLFSKKNDGNG